MVALSQLLYDFDHWSSVCCQKKKKRKKNRKVVFSDRYSKRKKGSFSMLVWCGVVLLFHPHHHHRCCCCVDVFVVFMQHTKKVKTHLTKLWIFQSQPQSGIIIIKLQEDVMHTCIQRKEQMNIRSYKVKYSIIKEIIMI